MADLTIIVLNGVMFASYLFLVSAGLTFVYGVMRILNTAHGSLYGFGAYAGASLVLLLWPGGLEGTPTIPPGFSYLALLLGALVVGVLVGPLMERVFIQRVVGRGEVIPLILTYALFLMCDDIMKLIWGVNPKQADLPYSMLGSFNIGGVNYPIYQLLLP